MSKRKRLCPFVVFSLMMMIVACAAGQRNTIGGIVGRTFISDQGVPGTGLPDSNIHFGNGFTFEANYARRLLDTGGFAVSVEIPAIFNPNQKLKFGGLNTPKSFASYFVTPSAQVHLFPDGGFSLWLSVGGGVGHFSPSSRLESGLPNPSSSGTTTGAFQLGGGLDVRIVHSLYLRGTVRELLSGEPNLNVHTGKSHYWNLFAGGGLAFRF